MSPNLQPHAQPLVMGFYGYSWVFIVCDSGLGVAIACGRLAFCYTADSRSHDVTIWPYGLRWYIHFHGRIQTGFFV